MKTDDFVSLLAAGAEPVAPGATARRYGQALVVGGLGAALLMTTLLGVRADIADAARTAMFWMKLAFPICLAAAAWGAATRLARPGVRLGRVPFALAAPLVMLWLLAGGMLLAAPAGGRLSLVFGQTWAMCPWLIALLSVPGFGATFWAMKGLAPTRPGLAGAAAGLLAGAVAAAVYALHCPEMAPPFLAVWYVLGMAIPAVAGAVLGPRLLRW